MVFMVALTIKPFKLIEPFKHSLAQVAELVDAADSKSAIRKDVLVRFQSWALKVRTRMKARAIMKF